MIDSDKQISVMEFKERIILSKYDPSHYKLTISDLDVLNNSLLPMVKEDHSYLFEYVDYKSTILSLLLNNINRKEIYDFVISIIDELNEFEYNKFRNELIKYFSLLDEESDTLDIAYPSIDLIRNIINKVNLEEEFYNSLRYSDDFYSNLMKRIDGKNNAFDPTTKIQDIYSNKYINLAMLDYLFNKDSSGIYPLVKLVQNGHDNTRTLILDQYLFAYIEILNPKYLVGVDVIKRIYEICQLLNEEDEYYEIISFLIRSNKLNDEALRYLYTKDSNGLSPIDVVGNKKDILFENLVHSELDDIRLSDDVFYEVGNHFADENMKGEVDPEFESLISRFKETMDINPNYHELVEFYIKSLRVSYQKNPELIKFTINAIINNIKSGKLIEELLFDLGYHNFLSGDKMDTSFYKFDRIVIKGCNFSTFTFMHETGHLLHDVMLLLSPPVYINNIKFDNYFENIYNKMKANNTFEKFLTELNAIYYQVIEKLTKELDSDEFFTSLFKDFDFRTVLSKYNIRYDIGKIIDENGSDKLKENIISNQKDIIVRSIAGIYIDINYPWLGAISDILDAISSGEMISKYGGLYYVAGHGEKYYKDSSNSTTFNTRFNEIFANFYTICSLCPDKLELLKELVGEDFVEFMNDFMNTDILHKDENEVERSQL